jgi:hypothetical protein
MSEEVQQVVFGFIMDDDYKPEMTQDADLDVPLLAYISFIDESINAFANILYCLNNIFLGVHYAHKMCYERVLVGLLF